MDQAERPPLPEAVEPETASNNPQETEREPALGRFSRRAFLAQLGATGVAGDGRNAAGGGAIRRKSRRGERRRRERFR